MTNELVEKLETDILVKHEAKAIDPWVNNAYIKAATSENTRIAYRSDIQHFESWGGKLPATPDNIAAYLQAFAESLNPRTLSRRLTALKHWHSYQGFPDPTLHPAIKKTMIGITRVHGKPKQKAQALTPDYLLRIAKHLDNENTLAAIRDNALLQIGFFGAFRRSELVKIQLEHIQWVEKGIEILLPHSKTDQLHAGQFCAIPFGKGLLCPVSALKNWLEISNIKAGAVFREIKRGERLKENNLSPLSVNLILKQRAEQCGIAEFAQLSGHSLRRGLATSATAAGANLSAIMRQGRWKQVNTVMEYVEGHDRFNDNAAMNVLKEFTSD